MARSRNIKPSFFSNDELADIDPVGRLLFIGLWTLADYKGEMVWRSKRVKAQLLPYDDCDIEEIAINLDKSGFIRFYSDSESIYLNIPNFDKHQNPHKNEREKGSPIPSYTESMRQVIDFKGLTINRDLSGVLAEDSTCNRADSLNLIPDSLNLIPDSCSPKIEEEPKTKNGKRFSPPQKIEVYDLFAVTNSTQDEADKFFDYYESNGWKVSRTKMKDWKASARNWIRRANEYNKLSKTKQNLKSETNYNTFNEVLGDIKNDKLEQPRANAKLTG